MSSGQDQMCVLEEENVENKTQSENDTECWHIKLKCGYQSKDPTTYLSLRPYIYFFPYLDEWFGSPFRLFFTFLVLGDGGTL